MNNVGILVYKRPILHLLSVIGSEKKQIKTRDMVKIFSLTVLLMSVGSYARAGVVRAPEIDSSSGVAAVALLSGGLLVLQTRRRRNRRGKE